MTENDYIIAQNLTRLRMMQEIYSTMIGSIAGEIDANDRLILGQTLHKMIEHAYKTMGDLKESK